MNTTRPRTIDQIQRDYDRAIRSIWRDHYRGRMTAEEARYEAATIRRISLKAVAQHCPGQMLAAD